MAGNIVNFIKRYVVFICINICILGLFLLFGVNYNAFIYFYYYAALIFPGMVLAEYYVIRNGEVFGLAYYFKLIVFSYPAFLLVWLFLNSLAAAASWLIVGTISLDGFFANIKDIYGGSYLGFLSSLFLGYTLFTGITLPLYAVVRLYVFPGKIVVIPSATDIDPFDGRKMGHPARRNC